MTEPYFHMEETLMNAAIMFDDIKESNGVFPKEPTHQIVGFSLETWGENNIIQFGGLDLLLCDEKVNIFLVCNRQETIKLRNALSKLIRETEKESENA